MRNVKNILMITTGGTIAGQVAENKQHGDKKGGEVFTKQIQPTVDFLRDTWKVEINITAQDVCDVDSSDILPQQWVDISNLIKKEYDNYDCFLVTHGTNTLGYTCAALTFAIANSNKPIVLTGSQVPSGYPGSDALMNLDNAIRVAVWPHQPLVKGVVAVFGSHIITGSRVKKSTEFDYDAFQSFSTGSLGRIGRIINFNVSNLERHLDYLRSKGNYNEALSADDLVCINDFDMRIISLTEFPGLSGDILKTLVDQNDIKGVIFRAFGAGDVSHHLHSAFEYFKENEIPVIVTTQAPNGNSNFQVNDPGRHLKENDLAIPAYDMSIESQTTKMAWLLGRKKKGEISFADVKRMILEDMRGEINVIIEQQQ